MFRRSLFLKAGPAPRAALLGALLVSGQAGASCDAPEELLTVRLGAATRGTVVVLLARDGARVTSALLPPEVLRPNEAGYVAGEVLCDGVRYVRLNPDLTLTYQEETQELLIRPAPAQLGQRDIDVSTALRREPPPVEPTFGIDFGARAALRYTLRGEPELPAGTPATTLSAAQAYVGLGGSGDRWTGTVGALYTHGSEREVQVRATAQFSVTPEVALTATYNASPSETQFGFTTTDFTGLTATYQRRTERTHPRLTLQLDAPTVITLFVNTTLLGTLSVDAGEINLLNIPLRGQGRNTIRLLLETDTGVREQNVEVPETLGLPGGLLARAQVGRTEERWVGEVSVQGAPTPTLLLQGQVQGASDGSLGAAVSARLSATGLPEGQSLSGTVGAKVAKPAPTAANPATQLSLNAGAEYTRGPLSASGTVAAPLNNIPSGTVALRAAYDARPWLFSGRLTSGLRPDSWEAEVGVTRILSARGSVSLTAAALPGGYRAGLRASYVFSPALQGAAAVNVANGRVTPSAALSYQLSPAQTLALDADPSDLNLSYSLNQPVRLDLQAGTRGASGQVRGALSLLGGELHLSPVLAQRGVYLRTGVPRLPLIVDGSGLVTTDGNGDLLITQVTPGQLLGVRVNTPELPLGVSVADAGLDVVPALTGLTVIDWRGNFTVSSFVRFFWTAAEEARDADLYLDGERIPLDDEGYGLVRRSTQARTGELRGPDGTRRCAVRLDPAAEAATCTAAPTPAP